MKWFLPFSNSKHTPSLGHRISLRASPLTKITWLSSEDSYNNIIQPTQRKSLREKTVHRTREETVWNETAYKIYQVKGAYIYMYIYPDFSRIIHDK